jgi:hypothetical protein
MLTLQSILCTKPELFTIKLFQNIVSNDFFTMSVPVDGYSRNVSCLLNQSSRNVSFLSDMTSKIWADFVKDWHKIGILQ